MLIFLQIEESRAPKYQILEALCQCQDVSIAYNIFRNVRAAETNGISLQCLGFYLTPVTV